MDTVKPWHEDDSFWDTWGALIFSEQRIKDAAGDVDKIIHLLNIARGAHVLDLGCGIGRHSLELARRGFKVASVDRTLSYLNRARKQAETEKLDIEFVHNDMRSFRQPESFDAVISMFTTFGYFEDIHDDRRVVENVFASLKPGGKYIIDTHGKETLARIFTENNWHEENGVLILEERKVTRNWSWMENRWIIIDGSKRTEFKVTHRLYSATELMALLASCGFAQVDAHGDLEGNPYDRTAKRLIVVARK